MSKKKKAKEKRQAWNLVVVFRGIMLYNFDDDTCPGGMTVLMPDARRVAFSTASSRVLFDHRPIVEFFRHNQCCEPGFRWLTYVEKRVGQCDCTLGLGFLDGDLLSFQIPGRGDFEVNPGIYAKIPRLERIHPVTARIREECLRDGVGCSARVFIDRGVVSSTRSSGQKWTFEQEDTEVSSTFTMDERDLDVVVTIPVPRRKAVRLKCDGKTRLKLKPRRNEAQVTLWIKNRELDQTLLEGPNGQVDPVLVPPQSFKKPEVDRDFDLLYMFCEDPSDRLLPHTVPGGVPSLSGSGCGGAIGRRGSS